MVAVLHCWLKGHRIRYICNAVEPNPNRVCTRCWRYV